MRSHVRTGWCQLTLAGPDPSITWLSIAAHPPTLGSLRPWPVGSPTSYHHRLSHGSLSQISSEKKEEQTQKSWDNILRPIEGLPGLAAILRHLAASGESSLVTWGAVVTRTSWDPGSGVSRPGSGGGSGASCGHHTVTRHWRGWQEELEAWQRPGLVSVDRSLAQDWGRDSDRGLRLGARPLLPTLSSGNIRTSQPGPAWLGLPTKYSRFFSPLKCVLKLLSFKTLAHRGSITQLKEERKGWSDHIQTEKLSCLSICRVIFQETGIVICLSECKKHGWGMFGPGTFDLWPRGREVRSVWMFGEWSPRRPGAQR